MHYDEELDLFCSCIRANISIIRQFMRLIVHFYSELTSNHHRVFVINSFCDHMCIYTLWAAVVHSKKKPKKLQPTDLYFFLPQLYFQNSQKCNSRAAALVDIPAVSIPIARSLKTCDICVIVLCDKTAHFRVALYCGTPVRWIDYLSKGEVLSNTDLDRFVNNI